VIALALAACLADHPLATGARWRHVRAVLSRDGDYFGPAVNLAARVVKLRHPAPCSYLPTSATRWTVTGPRRSARELKGIDETVALRFPQ
jgi:class 3 adenylate cyclase